jgi:AcrR family transcriptional regulator
MVKQRPYRSPVRERAAAATRLAILDAAEAAFCSDGYAAVTIGDIADRSEVSVGTVYSIFGGKPQLVAAVIEAAIADTESADIPGVLLDCRSGPAVIRALADHLMTKSQRWYWVYELGVENARTDPAITAAMDTLSQRAHHHFDAAVDRLVDLKAAKDEFDRAGLHDVLWYSLGPPAWHTLVNLGWSHERVNDFLVEQAVRTVLRRGRPSARKTQTASR